MSQLTQAIRSVFKDCLKIRRGEKLLILADDPLNDLGHQFYHEAQSFSQKSTFIVVPQITNHSGEPCKHVASFMREQDVIVLLTSRSMSHTNARRRACQNGARTVSLPGVTKEILIRNLTGEYKQLIDKSRKIADILTIGRSARLTTPTGTDFTFSLSRMKGYADTGMIHEPGRFSNLPAGEGSAAPVQESAQGKLIIDGSFAKVGRIEQPVSMSVKEGHVIRITGGEEAIQIRKLLRPYGKPGRNIAEIGIGTNPRAKVTGCTLEDEKSLGTVHVGLGNNVSFGGKVAVGCHFDGVLLNPTLVIDGKTIIEDGELQV
jgi:leucyl aminopeptidase (aminopeptidase T)